MSARHLDITLSVNGETMSARVEARKTLVDFLREDLSLTGTHVGCEHGVCGACTVLLDGEVVRGCLTFAVQCDGAVVETIEGLSDSGALADLQRAFQERNALQCRLLHARHADQRQGIIVRRRRAEPRGDPRTPLRQLLPLHRLSGDRRRGRGRGAGTGEKMKVSRSARPREGGDPAVCTSPWIPASAGMSGDNPDLGQAIFLAARPREGGDPVL